MITYIVSFIFVFSIVTLTHEMGHFIWARRSGMRVLELGIGFGPTLFRINRNNTCYSINLFPVLAFVRLAGLDEESEDERNCPDSEKYYTKSAMQKFKSIAAGPALNIILGFIILSSVSFLWGLPETTNEILVVKKGSVAENAGIKIGDKLIAMNGEKEANVLMFIAKIRKSADKNTVLTIERGGKPIAISVTPKYDAKTKGGLIGFGFKSTLVRSSFFSSFSAGAKKTIDIAIGIFFVLWGLIIGKFSVFDLAGPIGIAQISGQAASQGIESLIYFMGLISINLGIVNLLPIPALDGGRLIFIILEWIRKKPVNIKIENGFNQWGFIALLAFIAVVSIGDLLRVFSIRIP